MNWTGRWGPKYLEYMSPVLPLVIKPFIQHFHNLHEVGSESMEASQRGKMVDEYGNGTGCTSAGRFRSSGFQMGPMGR